MKGFQYYEMMDLRVPYYFFFYILGLMTTKVEYEKVINSKFWLCIMGSLLTVLFMQVASLQCVAPFWGMVAIITVSSMIKDANILTLNRVMAFVAYSSLCAYLYHRPIYRIFKTVLANENGVVSLYSVPLMVLTVIIVSWTIQKVYDEHVLKMFKN